MAALLFALASLIAVVPGILAVTGSTGVPPHLGVLFGTAVFVLAAMGLGLAWSYRTTVWLLPAKRLARIFFSGLVGLGSALTGYLLLYSILVVEHPQYGEKLLFPLWTSGQAAGMIHAAGSRYGALDKYGLAAVFDAISEMPGPSYAVTIGLLLLLYAPPLAGLSTMAALLALRYPAPSFSRGASPAEFDVFLCYNRADRLAVRSVATRLAAQGIRYFLDENENLPGQAWTDHVERAIQSAGAFAIFLGPAGIGNWQTTEIQNICEARMERACSVIPVLLPDLEKVKLPMQLAGLTWVDFRRSDPDPMAELIRGIRSRPASGQSEVSA